MKKQRKRILTTLLSFAMIGACCLSPPSVQNGLPPVRINNISVKAQTSSGKASILSLWCDEQDETLCPHGLPQEECPECAGGPPPDYVGHYVADTPVISTNTLRVGETLTITGRLYAYDYARYMPPSITYTSQNGYVYELSDTISDAIDDPSTGETYYDYTALFEAQEEGSDVIILSMENEFNQFQQEQIASFEVVIESTPVIQVNDISLDNDALSLEVAESAMLNATVYPENATDKTVCWSCDDISIATVSQDGLVTGVSEGVCHVTAATADGRKTAVCEVTVCAAAQKYSYYTTDTPVISTNTLRVGETLTITGRLYAYDYARYIPPSITYTSQNGYVYKLSDTISDAIDDPSTGETYYDYTALFEAREEGSDVITLSVENELNQSQQGQIASFDVVIESAPVIQVNEISLDNEALSLEVAESAMLNATVSPENATDKTVCWSCDDISIATVSQDGLVTGVSEGVCHVTAATADGRKTAVCEVTVRAATQKHSVICRAVANGIIATDMAYAASGEKITITAGAETGYVLNKLSVNDEAFEVIDGVVSYPFTMPDTDVIIRGEFTKIYYNIDVSFVGKGTASLYVNDIATEQFAAAYGDIVRIKLAPAPGYKTVGLSGTDFIAQSRTVYDFVMPEAPLSLKAEFSSYTWDGEINAPTLSGSDSFYTVTCSEHDARITLTRHLQNQTLSGYSDELYLTADVKIPDGSVKAVEQHIAGRYVDADMAAFDAANPYVMSVMEDQHISIRIPIAKCVNHHDNTMTVTPIQDNDLAEHGYSLLCADANNRIVGAYYINITLDPAFTEGITVPYTPSQGISMKSRIIWPNDTPALQREVRFNPNKIIITSNAGYFMDTLMVASEENPYWEICTILAPSDGWKAVSVHDSRNEKTASIVEDGNAVKIIKPVFEPYHLLNVNTPTEYTVVWRKDGADDKTETYNLMLRGDISEKRMWSPALDGISVTADTLRANGITTNYDPTLGILTASVDKHEVPSLDAIRAKALITMPDGATQYKVLLGYGDLNDTAFAQQQRALIADVSMKQIDGRFTPEMDLFEYRMKELDGIQYAVSAGDENAKRFAVYEFYDSSGKYISGAFLICCSDALRFESNSTGQEHIDAPVNVPTIEGSTATLNVTYYPQSGESDRYLMELNAPDASGPVTFYLPYGLTGMTYNDLRYGNVTIKHFYNGANDEQYETLTGNCTEYGIKFVMRTFSPVILEWEKGEKPQETLAITRQPVNCVINKGETARFSVEATGVGLKYQWYYRNKGAETWSVWSGKATAAMTTGTAASSNGRQAMCVITDENGNTLQSDAATIVFNDPFAITRQPVNCVINKGETARFSVEATGVGLKYQWYYRNKGAETWSVWSGKTTAAMTTGTAASSNGRQAMCVITDESGNTLQSDAATIVFNEIKPIVITQQPQDVTIHKGDKAVFTVAATGESLMYQWYYRNKGVAEWSVWTGKTATTLTTNTYNSSRERGLLLDY